MTRDEFNTKYDVHKPVAHGGPGVARSFFGRSLETKAVVLVHFLDAGARPHAEEALARLQALGPEDRKQVLETCEVDGTVVVVTRFIWDFTTFDAWLVARSRLSARVEPSAAAPAPGEFTGLFGSPATPPAAGESGSAAGVGSPPGEFTRLFNQQARPPGPAPPSPALGGPRDVSEAVTEHLTPPAPGEFTRLFRAPSTPESHARPEPARRAPTTGGPPSDPRPPEPAKPGPGEFTRLFGAPPTAQGPGNQAAPPSPPLPAPPPTPPAAQPPVFPTPSAPADDLARRLARGADRPPGSSGIPPAAPRMPPEDAAKKGAEPGDFTRMFGGVGPPPEVTGPRTSLAMPSSPFSSRPPDPLPLPSSMAGPGGPSATDYLARLHGAAPPPAAGPPPGLPPAPPAPAGPPKAAGGPSEFTRALQRISLSSATAETDLATEEPPAARSALPTVLIICGVLLLTALGVVLYFVLTME